MVALAAALVPAAALLFAAGVWVGGRAGSDGGDDLGRPASKAPATRNFYSTHVLDDPQFLERQRENVATLERHCRESGMMCAEARAARRWLDEQAD